MGIFENIGGLVAIVIVLIILAYLATRIRIVQQATCIIIERLGNFNRVCNSGIHFFIPFIERPVRKLSLKEQVIDFPPQPVITKDNVTIQIDTVIFFQVTDPERYTYGVSNPLNALENLTATTLRNIIGDLELDESLTSRDTINSRMRSILDEASDPWGVKVNRVELKNILPPLDIQQAMEKQMRAEREKRESILIAEGEKISAITKATGEKESIILRAEARKEEQIRHAEGEAEAIRLVNEATAQGLEYIKDINVDQGVINIKSLETFAKVADGQATKIVIPSDIQNMAGLATSLTEIIKTGDVEK
ncbi:regulator of protease activity HflC (stomatin/prohibitin superfamily) [Bacilli bacterium PM5-3]|nr:regulator of protease activity HflC (stomatin/prohibitin superfamily) [Bacilli bacterium PM5-3]MDH6603720.1 regulator of protease activity HflC (stomatin/prohibitin superfamily) [Bacilli bacterium PM5-9]